MFEPKFVLVKTIIDLACVHIKKNAFHDQLGLKPKIIVVLNAFYSQNLVNKNKKGKRRQINEKKQKYLTFDRKA